MKKKKKLLTGLLTFVMMLSLIALPGGVVQAADGEPVNYFIYFDAANGKLYKEEGVFYSSANSWEAKKNVQYSGDNSISCDGNKLILHDFSLNSADTAIVIKGNAVLQLEGTAK